jgi:hypothetical protein
LTYGLLTVKAYADSEEVAAEVEIVGVGKYHTPFKIYLTPGTYILIADWMGQEQIKGAEIQQDKTTETTFIYEKPSMKWAYFYVGTSLASLAIAILGLWFTVKGKK